MAFEFSPLLKGDLQIKDTGSSDSFITDGANGITNIRWQSTPGGVLYDMTVDDTGHVVTTASGAGTTGRSMGLLLALTYP